MKTRKDVELLVLRQENQVLRRQVGQKPRWDHTDRLWLTALSRLVNRGRWAEIGRPTTVIPWPHHHAYGSARAGKTTGQGW
ncbi:hypothetical protein NE236_18665 [Actinoallomurus purpureus]|uniref:hypothetical protein n=1 Tax=Actinoallomurus purpureus TaxID=478114 RepID=UPI0020925C44|nr:hypothetical protein [Actinoallomurus purpureus]MCO6007013.1 hypothetical protein [Actinoallomurus purpureus]